MTEKEEWRPVAGYESSYEVSNQGRVRSLDRLIGSGMRQRLAKGRILKLGKVACGQYYTVQLHSSGACSARYVHHLVAEAFIGPRPEAMLVLHGPAGSLVNQVSNLSYGTRSDNMGRDRLRDGTHSRGEKCGTARLTATDIMAIRSSGKTTIELAKIYGVTQSYISAILTGKNWAHLPHTRPSLRPRARRVNAELSK
jgi:hypothetical protein